MPASISRSKKHPRHGAATAGLTPDVSVVIVSWNARDLLAACLRSLTGTSSRLEVILVDNNSADDSIAVAQTVLPAIQALPQAENRGFARANNVAFARATADLVLLLNPDTVMAPGAIDRLVRFLELHPRCGVVAPKIVHPAGRLRVLSGGRQPSLRAVFNHFSGLSRFSRQIAALEGLSLVIGVHDDRPRRVEWVSGACMLVRTDVIAGVGPLPEDWFMYGEDMEWCDRITQGGWEIWHDPEAIVSHLVGGTQEDTGRVSSAWVTNLRHHYRRRHAPSKPYRLLFDALLGGGLLTRSLTYLGLGIVDGDNRRLWMRESRRFLAYARSAVSPLRVPAIGHG